MIRAIMAGNKSQTRRVVSRANSLVNGHPASKKMWDSLDFSSDNVFVDKGPSPAGNAGPYFHVPTKDGETVHRVYPRVQPQDEFWCKETFSQPNGRVHYRADDVDHTEVFVWCPSIFMPRALSRITIRVDKVRGVRLNDITEKDVLAEGILKCKFKMDQSEVTGFALDGTPWEEWCTFAVDAYRLLWEKINGSGSWNANPLLWCYSFCRTKP